jgi:hypothetical protein
VDKGYSYPRVRDWRRRHHIGSVIPTREDRPADPNFDEQTYRKRNIIARVVGWFEECRAPGTRDDKWAVNSVALWVVANIHRLLRKRLKYLENPLSETTWPEGRARRPRLATRRTRPRGRRDRSPNETLLERFDARRCEPDRTLFERPKCAHRERLQSL